MNNAVVLIEKTDKKSIEDFGDAEKFLTNITYLLGEQSYFGGWLLSGWDMEWLFPHARCWVDEMHTACRQPTTLHLGASIQCHLCRRLFRV